MLPRLQPSGTGRRRPSRCISCTACTRCSPVAASCTARMPAAPGSAWPSIRMRLLLLLLLMLMLMLRRWAPWRVRPMSPPRNAAMRHPRSHAQQRWPRKEPRQRIRRGAWLRLRWGPAGASDLGCTVAAEGSHDDDAATWTASSPYMQPCIDSLSRLGGRAADGASRRVRRCRDGRDGRIER